MKTLSEKTLQKIRNLDAQIKLIIHKALITTFTMSPVEKTASVYADIEVRFREIHKLMGKELIK